MPRPDLIALTPDDLATLANRGLVKRAQTELNGGELEYTLSENKAGTVSVLWSDDVHCLLPSNVPLQQAQCSCPATTLCRHLLRSVLAYQREQADAPQSEAPAIPQAESPGAPPQEATSQPAGSTGEASVEAAGTPISFPPNTPAQIAWNPGEINEEQLAAFIPAATLARAQREWDTGHVIETTGGPKPSAYFHSAGVNLRFLVPHDARYTHCDCAEAPPCPHVPMAVRAFREVREGEVREDEVREETLSGLVSTRKVPLEVPVKLLDEMEAAIQSLATDGISHLNLSFVDHLTRIERDCREAGLLWPADIVSELHEQIDFYRGHNARFEPVRVAQLVGELLVRADAIRSDTNAVPPLFVRGAGEKTTEVGAARLVGLGTQARVYRDGAEIFAFLQDVDSGAVVTIRHNFPNPQADPSAHQLGFSPSKNAVPEPAPLWKLGTAPISKGVGLTAVGGGQLLVRGGKRSPSGEFTLGRAPTSFNLQSFQWEKLRPPLLMETFAALTARMQMLPPASLRPRRLGEDVHVVPIAGVEVPHFDRAEQTIRVILRDSNGDTALLVHPFTARGAEGFENLLHACTHLNEEFRFISARFAWHAGQLVAFPFALVLGDGENRRAIQPWLERRPAATTNMTEPVISAWGDNRVTEPFSGTDPLRDFGAELVKIVGETFQIGLQRSDAILARRWEAIVQQAHALGLTHTGQLIEKFANELGQKARVRHWESSASGALVQEIAVHALLLGEIV